MPGRVKEAGRVRRRGALPRLAPWQGWQLERDLHYERIEGAEHNEAAWARRVGPFLPFFVSRRLNTGYNPRSLFEGKSRMLAARCSEKTMSPDRAISICVSPLTKRGRIFCAPLQGLGLHGLSFDCRELRKGIGRAKAIDEMFFMPEELPLQISCTR